MTRSVSDNKRSGFVTLFSVIILMMISSFIVTEILISSNVTIQDNASYRDAIQARALADSCANVALNKLKLSNSYTGNETVTIGSKTCNILTISGSGNTNRVVQTTATIGNVTRKIEVSVSTIAPSTEISYWIDSTF